MGLPVGPRRGKRVSAIDVGSNSLRLMIGEELEDNLTLIVERGASTRLAEGIWGERGDLSPQAMERTIRALGKLLSVARVAGVFKPRIAATEALRRADNSAALLDLASENLGVKIEILDAAHEAKLTFQAVRDHLSPVGHLAIVDLGGGSLEIAEGIHKIPRSWSTYPLGCIALTESSLEADPPGIAAWEKTREYAAKTLRGNLPVCDTLVGCGGAFTSTAGLAMGAMKFNRAKVKGYRLEFEKVCEIGRSLSAMSVAERCKLPSISTSRAYLAPAGTAVIAALLELGSGWCLVSDRGFAWGLLLETWIESRPTEETSLPSP